MIDYTYKLLFNSYAFKVLRVLPPLYLSVSLSLSLSHMPALFRNLKCGPNQKPKYLRNCVSSVVVDLIQSAT